MTPTYAPMNITLTTSERYCGVDHRTISAWVAGSITPSPSPDKTRSVTKTPTWILAAAGVSRATSDDTRTLPPHNHLPPNRSAAQPPGIYKQTFDRQLYHVLYCILSHVIKTDWCQCIYPPFMWSRLSGRFATSVRLFENERNVLLAI